MVENSIKSLDFPYFEDERGSFEKLYHKIDTVSGFHIKQVNYVNNPFKNVFRGLHYQTSNYQEAKIFRVLKGEILLVAFCYLSSHKDYLKTFTFALSKKKSILVPEGFATGYVVKEDHTEILYISSNDYHPPSERGIKYNDPVLSLELPQNLIISEKDKKWPRFDNS